ncbi:Uma2 family endonuclease [Fodinicola feengrottensis]|uniref:Uma2 family endonuclease n=2 Tax=Fodinicola feengrottensis TaxID=435914 RepID=A0ABN2IWD4_9ACTN|nr:Uma2 family endonuclease [Fodinicola feengrottensis]
MVAWPNHLLTLTEWDALPEDTSRHVELVDGMLVVAPKATPRHQFVRHQLAAVLNSQLPVEWVAIPEVEVIVDATHPPTVRAPDVVITSSEILDTNPPRLPADQVVVAVEVISSGSRCADRVTKLVEYAEAGIPRYWLFDLTTPLSVRTYELFDRAYQLTNDMVGGVFSTDTPAPLRINVTSLGRR